MTKRTNWHYLSNDSFVLNRRIIVHGNN